jgi:BirA family biotin operon repressor/biotin-[acetyl-CoA-carboxylase] ligase
VTVSPSQRVLEVLYDRGGFVSLDELIRITGLNRAYLDEAMGELRGRGHVLDVQPADGVRLIHPVRLNAHLIERGLETRRVGRSVICFDQVDSTNDVAMASARQRDTDGLVVTAEWQRKGRGRRRRRWLSPPGAGLLFSVLLVNDSEVLGHEATVVAAGLAVAEGIDDSCHRACRLKWPNDVYLEGAKAAGVLVETQPQDSTRAMVVGIGINVYAAPPPEMTDRRATHLAAYAAKVDRIDLIRHILRRLDHRLVEIMQGEFDDLHNAWVRRSGMVNERVRILSDGVEYVGRVVDVSPMEGLILACDDGRHVCLPAATSLVVG